MSPKERKELEDYMNNWPFSKEAKPDFHTRWQWALVPAIIAVLMVLQDRCN